jgi:hypothetical protein
MRNTRSPRLLVTAAIIGVACGLVTSSHAAATPHAAKYDRLQFGFDEAKSARTTPKKPPSTSAMSPA